MRYTDMLNVEDRVLYDQWVAFYMTKFVTTALSLCRSINFMEREMNTAHLDAKEAKTLQQKLDILRESFLVYNR